MKVWALPTLLLVFAGLLMCGCAREPMTTLAESKGADETVKYEDDAFLYEMSDRVECTQADLVRGILMLKHGEDTGQDFEDRVRILREDGIWPEDWPVEAKRPVTKGEAALLVCKAMDIKGGVMMHLLPSPRYAFRELQYMKLIKGESDMEYLKGAELVDLMNKVDMYRQEEARSEAEG
jgi:hypothetical protein